MKQKIGKMLRKRRTVVLITATVLLVVLLFTFLRMITNHLVNIVTKNMSLQYSRELDEQMSAHISSIVDYYFHELNTDFNALLQIEDLTEEKIESFITELQEKNNVSYLAFADEEGFVYEADGSYLGTMRISFLGELMNGETRLITDNQTVDSESYIMIGTSFEKAVMLENHAITIAIMGLDDETLSEHLILQSDYSGGYASIIHRDGSYVIKNAKGPFSGLNVFSILEKNGLASSEVLASAKRQISKGEDCFIATAGEQYFIYFAPIGETEWYLANVLPGAFVKQNLTSFRTSMNGLYISIGLILMILAALVLFQQIRSAEKLEESKKQTEDALKLAEEASNAKTAFLFNMSHDIRTPMNAILGYTDIGLRHVADEEVSRDSYQKIKIAGGHLLNLINDILEMSRIESGKVELEEKPLDIIKAIHAVNDMSLSLAIKKGIDFKTEIGKLPNSYIYADELHVNEVVINLISNAVKYTPEEGRVRYRICQLSAPENGTAVYRFEISDNGIGMSEEFQKHLFENFSREQNTTLSGTEGTGLGLAIVKKIVDMVGGTIAVHSVQGEGSVFTVDIPFRVLSEAEIEAFNGAKKKDEEIVNTLSFAGKRVLLAEDNELNREIATFILEDAELKVDTAEDGDLAVKAVINKGIHYYDFILMDIQMPVMNGYEATKAIRALPEGDSVPIIALSANAFEEDKKKSLAEGMNAHVAKPINIQELLETIQKIVK